MRDRRDTIIFDLDGTLLDTLDDLTGSVNACMEKYGGPLYRREQVRDRIGNGVAVLIEKSLPRGRDNPEFENCLRGFFSHYRAHLADQTRPYSGILGMLGELKMTGWKMAIVSNKFDAAVKELNRKFFPEYISVALGESAGLRRKPAPDLVYAAMRELGSEPGKCIYAGDSGVDIETAANAGIPCVSVAWGFKSREFLEEHGAETVVSEPRELPVCVQMLTERLPS